MENVRHDCFLDRARRFFGRHPWSSAGKERPVERLTEKIARLGFAPTPAHRSPGSRRPKAVRVVDRGLGYASSDLFRIGRLCR